MAPVGAARRLVTPGPDPMAVITGILFSLLLHMTGDSRILESGQERLIDVDPVVSNTEFIVQSHETIAQLGSKVLSYTSGLPTRTEKLISENDLYYWVEQQNGRIACLLCPAGTYVKEVCTTQYSAGRCEMCLEGTYIEFSSGLSDCLSCTICRDDQEEVSSCSSKKNTVCRCKKGTFCPPGQPCEICTPCTTSCPEDQVMNAPCNSTSDSLCTTPGSPSDNTDNRNIIITYVVVSLAFIILVIITIVVYKWRKRRNTNTGSKLFGKLTVHICKGNEDPDEAQGNLLPRDVKLKLKEGIDSDTKDEVFSKSCAIIVRVVPIKEFDSLMLCLGLGHNEIERAKTDNVSNVNNQNSAMLRAWYLKKDLDINSLLKALRDQNMEKAANDITDQLIKEELYVPQAD
ncbi:tumor necrosis factor receptor superfamily member 6-like [Mantella aurantiaca]